MSALSIEEINKLKQMHPKKRILRYIFLFIGNLLIILGTLFLLFGVDFGVSTNDVNLSFAIDILIIIFGMIIASKFFIAPYYLRENSLVSPLKKMRDLREPVENYVKFNSFALSRLLAAGYFIVAGFWSLTVFGLGIGHHETRYGNAIVLGGPSFFYVTGLPALIIGFSLLLYVVLSTFRGTFSESKNFYFFYELRPMCPWLTEIPKQDIKGIRYQNNHIGPKLAWIILVLPFIVLQLMTAIPLFFNNERAAPEYVFSTTLTIISIIEIAALIILVAFPQNYYEIATDDMLYEMWFAPIKLRNQTEITNKLANFFNCGIKEGEIRNEGNIDKNQSLFSELSNTHFQLFDLIFGLFLIISSIIMLTQMVLFGPWFWWIALMYGFMLLVKALCYDFSKRGEDKFFFDEENRIFKFQRKFGYKFHYITAYDVDSISVKKWYRKLDFFDIFGLGCMIIMLVLQQIEGWSIVNSYTIIDNVISTIYMIIVFIFIILYLCLPIDVIEFQTPPSIKEIEQVRSFNEKMKIKNKERRREPKPSIIYQIRVTTKKDNQTLLKKYFHNLKSFPKEVLKDNMKKTFLIRILIVIILFAITLIYTLINLVIYFS
ncbi:MAG: hypothetical protein ACTSQG_03545 [Promethearchaeota archaeon]